MEKDSGEDVEYTLRKQKYTFKSTLMKNMWLEKLKRDLLQNQYNLSKVGLYHGFIKEGIENLLEYLKDFE